MKLKLPERRQFVRVDVPLKAEVEEDGQVWMASTKNVSPSGLGIETPKEIKGSLVKIKLHLPEEADTIRLEGRVVWQEKTSLQDNAPYSVGIEIEVIEEDKKNVFLKFLCDMLYGSVYNDRK
ncbi:MAG: PilZ domain-containing protein [Candidatus Omnitrophota bacterium]